MWHDARIPACSKSASEVILLASSKVKVSIIVGPENQILRSSARKGRLAESGSIHPAKGPLVVGQFRDLGCNARSAIKLAIGRVMESIKTLLEQQPLMALFLTIAIGYLVG
ncbi:MAG: hypothetical protein WBL40_00315, partial [Terrimicrobiaceae bacterium]